MADPIAPPPGFYEDATGRRRWWDGTAWTEHAQTREDAAPAPSSSPSEQQRRRVLQRAVDAYVQEGYRLESLSDRQAVVTRRQRVRVGVNVLLTIVTAGFWLLILALRLLDWPVDRAVLTVDDDGNLDGSFSS